VLPGDALAYFRSDTPVANGETIVLSPDPQRTLIFAGDARWATRCSPPAPSHAPRCARGWRPRGSTSRPFSCCRREQYYFLTININNKSTSLSFWYCLRCYKIVELIVVDIHSLNTPDPVKKEIYRNWWICVSSSLTLSHCCWNILSQKQAISIPRLSTIKSIPTCHKLDSLLRVRWSRWI